VAHRGGTADLLGRPGMVTWLFEAVDAQLQRDAGISHYEYQVMAMLSMSPQRPGG
jgi:hypothetical protein